MEATKTSAQGKSWLSAAWAVLPIVLVVAAVVGGKPGSAVTATPVSAAIGVAGTGFASVIVPASLDAPASADEPLARYGQ